MGREAAVRAESSAPGSPREVTSGSSVWGQLKWALRAARQNPMQLSASPGPAAPQHAIPQGAARQAATGPRHGDGAVGVAPASPAPPRDAAGGSSVRGQMEWALRAARQSPMQQPAKQQPAKQQPAMPQSAVAKLATGPRRGEQGGVGRGGSLGGVGRRGAEGAAPRVKGPGARLCRSTKFPRKFPTEFWFAGEADLRTQLGALFGRVAPAGWRVPQASPPLERGGSVSVWGFRRAIP